ncbi:hypothetical protein CALVIDRAFT_311066 [Calocera viscosa TUFC12733]|uniref:Uncharacterized protein n=1 Tax=Calocera viscosa (strain TUFC12733) TaxID=1330018 RepID=A0A167I3D3_CALVF|nr:hypothetical protein CALVIDRAFT_311066 [Calocera viscosa TUFC12733]
MLHVHSTRLAHQLRPDILPLSVLLPRGELRNQLLKRHFSSTAFRVPLRHGGCARRRWGGLVGERNRAGREGQLDRSTVRARALLCACGPGGVGVPPPEQGAHWHALPRCEGVGCECCPATHYRRWGAGINAIRLSVSVRDSDDCWAIGAGTVGDRVRDAASDLAALTRVHCPAMMLSLLAPPSALNDTMTLICYFWQRSFCNQMHYRGCSAQLRQGTQAAVLNEA